MKKYVITTMDDILYDFVFDDEKLAGIHVYEKKRESLLGNIYVGRVQNIVGNINAAFVEISKDIVCYYPFTSETRHIFLNKKNTDKLCVGDLILVQMEKEGVKTKQPTVTSNISLCGVYCALSYDFKSEINISKKIKDSEFKKKIYNELSNNIKDRDYSIIVRTSAYEADRNEVMKEIHNMCDIMDEIILKSKCRPGHTCLYEKEPLWYVDYIESKPSKNDTVITDDKIIFDRLKSLESCNGADVRFYEDKLLPLFKLYSLSKHIEDALSKRVWLKSGAYIVIEYTEALTVIDVNTGKFDKKKNREETFFRINLEAWDEILRQIRIRNISGIIIIDFINVEKAEHKEALCEKIKESLKSELIPVNFVDMTKLDLVELTRKKIKKPLYEIIK